MLSGRRDTRTTMPSSMLVSTTYTERRGEPAGMSEAGYRLRGQAAGLLVCRYDQSRVHAVSAHVLEPCRVSVPMASLAVLSSPAAQQGHKIRASHTWSRGVKAMCMAWLTAHSVPLAVLQSRQCQRFVSTFRLRSVRMPVSGSKVCQPTRIPP